MLYIYLSITIMYYIFIRIVSVLLFFFFTGEKISLLWKFISIYLNGLTLNFHYLLLEGASDRYERECYKASLYHLIFASL